MRKLLAVTLVFVLLISCAGCSVSDKSSDVPETRDFTDSTGVTVQLPKDITRIVSMANYCGQIIIGLGFGDSLIGMTEETVETAWLDVVYPNYSNITIVGETESAEALLKLNPDVVIVNDAAMAEDYRAKGLTTVMLSYYSIDEYENYITLLCELLGPAAEKKGAEYLDYFHSNIALVSQTLEGQLDSMESMYYINGVSNKGLIKTTGRGSTNSELARLSFVSYVTDGLIESPANKVDEEAVIATNPDNIIIGGVYQHVLYTQLMSSDVWAEVKAVRDGHVYKVPMGISPWNRYGIEIALMIPWTAATIYPEYFEYDMVGETIKFYETFTGCRLTEEQVNFMLNGLTPQGEMEIPG